MTGLSQDASSSQTLRKWLSTKDHFTTNDIWLVCRAATENLCRTTSNTDDYTAPNVKSEKVRKFILDQHVFNSVFPQITKGCSSNSNHDSTSLIHVVQDLCISIKMLNVIDASDPGLWTTIWTARQWSWILLLCW